MPLRASEVAFSSEVCYASVFGVNLTSLCAIAQYFIMAIAITSHRRKPILHLNKTFIGLYFRTTKQKNSFLERGFLSKPTGLVYYHALACILSTRQSCVVSHHTFRHVSKNCRLDDIQAYNSIFCGTDFSLKSQREIEL